MLRPQKVLFLAENMGTKPISQKWILSNVLRNHNVNPVWRKPLFGWRKS